MPDPVYNSTLVEKFVNSMMWQGKKNTAQGIFYDAMDKIRERTSDDPLKAFKKAVENAKPLLEVKTRRVGGANYQVPDRSAAEPADFAGHALDHHQRAHASRKGHGGEAGERVERRRATCAAERSRRRTTSTAWRRRIRPSRIIGGKETG